MREQCRGASPDTTRARRFLGRCRWLWRYILVMLLVGSGLLTGGVWAANRAGPFLIGALTDSWGPTPGIVGLRDRLLALGYHEEAQFVIGVRFTQGEVAALPAAAHELVAHSVDLIFAHNDNTAKAAQQATSRIPIVIAGGDPVGTGLIQSLARPGGNLTGVTDLALELGPKRLQVFQEIIPGLKRVLFAYDADDAASVTEAKGYRDAAHRLGITLVERAVRTQEEAQAVLSQPQKDEVDGLLVPRSLALNIPGFLGRLPPSGRCRSCATEPSGWSGAASPVMVRTFTTRAGRQRPWWTRFCKGRHRQPFLWR